MTLVPTQGGDTNAYMMVSQVVEPVTVEEWKSNANHLGVPTSTSSYTFRTTVAKILGPVSTTRSSNNDPSITVLDVVVVSVTVFGPVRRSMQARERRERVGAEYGEEEGLEEAVEEEEETEEEETEASRAVRARRLRQRPSLRRRLQPASRAPSPRPSPAQPSPAPTAPVPTFSPTVRPRLLVTYQVVYHPRTMEAKDASDGYNLIMGALTDATSSDVFTMTMRTTAQELSNFALEAANSSSIYSSLQISTPFPTSNPSPIPTQRPTTMRPSPLPTRAAQEVIASFFTKTDIIIAVVVIVFVVALLVFFYFACRSPKKKVLLVRTSSSGRPSQQQQRTSIGNPMRNSIGNPMYPQVLPKNVYGGSGYQGPAPDDQSMGSPQDSYPSQQDMAFGYGHSQGGDAGGNNMRSSRGSLSRSSFGERRFSAHDQMQQMMTQRRLSEAAFSGDASEGPRQFPPNNGL